ncbi:hypothetical protein [Ferrimonas marina]|uniref:Uncharacterized protein n=1 Tax=Ferrimonas marina TaxID=299255 RepID=A0A1M5XXN7_9GAMM|nr:hypothetical protein [Ferrimonas marina]SHI04013.1 hypothetical protein SAMN02745129_3751 [Ferrimonas marina]
MMFRYDDIKADGTLQYKEGRRSEARLAGVFRSTSNPFRYDDIKADGTLQYKEG